MGASEFLISHALYTAFDFSFYGEGCDTLLILTKMESYYLINDQLLVLLDSFWWLHSLLQPSQTFATSIYHVAFDLFRWLQHFLYWDRNQSKVRFLSLPYLYLKISLYLWFTFPLQFLSLRKICSFSLPRLTPRFVLFILSFLSQTLIASITLLASIFNLLFSTRFFLSAFKYVLVSPSWHKRGCSINI